MRNYALSRNGGYWDLADPVKGLRAPEKVLGTRGKL
jgi:hypothetical protein